jgi:hypothetical protein
MSAARPRPIRPGKNQIRFVDAADRADFLDSLDWGIDQYRRINTRESRSAARRLVRRRRALLGLVIGA